ncbi:MAG TPA: hypothetical protein VFD76_08565 [Gemmatimonadales bacterium]|nr:hypothetical protein [Gemmatimonadales bacterium]
MSKTWQVASLLVFAAATGAAAQRPAHAAGMSPHVTGGAVSGKQPTADTRGTESAEHVKSFSGIAAKLNTTPDALQAAYEQARTTDPKLTRGQFIAAEVLGHNLADKGITTDKILAGLASGKSIGQTLRSLGLSDDAAKDAEQTADREAKEADKAKS